MELHYLKWTSGSMVLGKKDLIRRDGGTGFNLSSLCTSSAHHQFLHEDRAGGVRCRRGKRFIVATGPAIEAPQYIATEPLTKDDLVNYFVSGCKPKEKWR